MPWTCETERGPAGSRDSTRCSRHFFSLPLTRWASAARLIRQRQGQPIGQCLHPTAGTGKTLGFNMAQEASFSWKVSSFMLPRWSPKPLIRLFNLAETYLGQWVQLLSRSELQHIHKLWLMTRICMRTMWFLHSSSSSAGLCQTPKCKEWNIKLHRVHDPLC